MSSELTELSPSDCDLLLASLDFGRIAVVENGQPLVFPINLIDSSFRREGVAEMTNGSTPAALFMAY